jgi:hypothetical protein
VATVIFKKLPFDEHTPKTAFFNEKRLLVKCRQFTFLGRHA